MNQDTIEAIKALYNKGMPVEKIASAFELPLEDVKSVLGIQE